MMAEGRAGVAPSTLADHPLVAPAGARGDEATRLADGARAQGHPNPLTRSIRGVAVVQEDGVAGRIEEPGPMADARVPHLVDLDAGCLELYFRLGYVRHTQRERPYRQRREL